MNRKIRVLIVDDREIFREGLAKLLHEQEQIEVVAKCPSGRQAALECRKLDPDVVLVGTDSPPSEDAAAADQIGDLSHSTQVAVLAHSRDRSELISAMEAGATGYLSKQMSLGRLVESIRLIAGGEIVISPPDGDSSAFAFATDRTGASHSPLSEREMEIVRLLVKGATNREMAEALVITENTVKAHVKHVLDKLQLRNRQQVVAHAVQEGWLASTPSTDDGEG